MFTTTTLWVKCKVQSRCSLGEISEKPSCKLENVVSTIYKKISNINSVFTNCLQMRSIFAIFFTRDDVLVGNVTVYLPVKRKFISKPLILCHKVSDNILCMYPLLLAIKLNHAAFLSKSMFTFN